MTYADLRLEDGPYGAIRWPARTDKVGKEWTTPINPGARAAVDRIRRLRPTLGSTPLFPTPGKPHKPISRHYADKWLREAEELAELEPQEGSLWHAYRRAWATARKHLPAADVAAAGGWKNAMTVQKVVLQVVLGGHELRADSHA